MSFKCQKDSYLQTLSTRVVSCEPSKHGVVEGYEVLLEDTVLFPEGGGQPDDRGKINGIDVLKVTRRGSKAVHFVTSPLQIDSEVTVEVDWKRRFDHMQQHSGQHLITAIADKEYGIKTASWCLAIGQENRCYVELCTKSISKEQLERVEQVCNEKIRMAVPMVPHWYNVQDPKMEAVRSRGLPDDFEGQEIRVVEIEGIDANTCCGTHVSNLSHLQCIKLVHSEPKKGNVLVYYLAGDRVMSYMERAIANERSLTKVLSVGAEGHVECVDKMVKENKHGAKVIRNMLRDLAQLLAFQHLHSNNPVDPVATIHRDDGDNEFMNILANELTAKGVLVMVTVGGDRGAGQFLLAGEEEVVVTLGPQVAVLLEGKGGGRKGRYQGKVSSLERRGEAYQLIRDFRK